MVPFEFHAEAYYICSYKTTPGRSSTAFGRRGASKARLTVAASVPIRVSHAQLIEYKPWVPGRRSDTPGGHFEIPHPWPVKIPQGPDRTGSVSRGQGRLDKASG